MKLKQIAFTRLYAIARALNLSMLEAELAKARIHPRLRDKARRALVAQSCLGDLREAQGHFAALQKLLKSVRGTGSDERASPGSALQSMAVLLYAKATQTNANRRGTDGRKERGPSQIRDQLVPTEQDDHDVLVSVRSQALAHVYTNEVVAGFEWHSSAVLLVETADGWLPGAASRRVILSPTTLAA
jgi:hypothetical protein